MGLFGGINSGKTQKLLNQAVKKAASSKANGATLSNAAQSGSRIANALLKGGKK